MTQKTKIDGRRNNGANPALRIGQEQQRAKGAANREAVLRALGGLSQPVTVAEISASLAGVVDRTSVRNALGPLAESGLVLHRKETAAERSLRFDGRQPMAAPAELYWLAARGPVAERTVVEAVPGVTLTGPLKPMGRKPGSKNKQRAGLTRVKARAVTAIDLNAASLDVLVEKLVEARHASLVAENSELRETVRRVLAEARGALDSLADR
jgi:hypothetical protein